MASDAMSGAPALARRLDAVFRERFGRAPEVATRAPGRVNLIGEHTDYNEGLVLPCAIDRDTVVLAAARDDATLRVFAHDLDAEVVRSLPAGPPSGDFSDYCIAPAAAWGEAGVTLPGIDLVVASAVPRESGLSSSAALGVAIATAWAAVAGIDARPRDIADRVHRGENHYVGVGCGILDQYASALGQPGAALRIDCRTRHVDAVPLGDAPLAFVVARSGVTRALADGQYAERVAECAAALDAAKGAGLVGSDARALRDLCAIDLAAIEAALDGRPLRRARHFVTECARVDAFLEALAAGDRPAAGEWMRQSQASLRDDYEVSVPELDALCEIADAHPACFGSRLTGAGWGGCAIHLVDPDGAAELMAALDDGFVARAGRRAEPILVVPSEGAGLLDPSA